jgi:glycosyltransferase involved in cell wall biosynthesis
MRITFLTGIWPPDVGGPATHGPDFSRFLVERGHQVHVVTMGDGEPAERTCEVEVVSRGLPFPIRYGLVAIRSARAARQADVVYASATYAAAAIASLLAGRPLVVKLVSDPAYERALRYRLFRGTLEEFQSASSRAVRLLQRLRNAALRRAVTIVVPSAYQREIAAGWGLDRSRIHVLTNPAPPPRDVEAEPLGPGTFVFVGRLTPAKALGTAIDAFARLPDARLVVVGEGPERPRLEALAAASDAAGRIEFRGSRSRDDALEIVAGAVASVLSSDYENLPHSAVEALSVGVPVVATAVGGVPEVVHDGENGLLVPPGRPDELAAALRRVLEEDGLRDRLAAAAKPSVAAISSEAIYGRLEALLAEAAR